MTDALDKRRVLNDGKYEYQYDDEGNLTQKRELSTGNLTNYGWDYRNRLTSVTSGSQTVEYGYDAEDRRVGKKINGVVRERYVYDGDDIALVVDAAGTIVERYLDGAGVDNVLSCTSTAGVMWSLADRQGSVVDLVDEGGNVLNHFVYDSFGNRTATTGVDFRFGYTGRELDAETGLYYYRARYYDPTMGRFISEDPIGFGAGDPNLYRYVSNSPTNFNDPSGLIWANLGAGALNVVIDAGLQLLTKGEIDDIGSLGVSFATGFIGVGLADKAGKLLSASRTFGQVATKYKYATSIATNAFVDGGVGATVQVGSNIVTGKNWSENVWETSTSQALFGAVGNTITLGTGAAWNKYTRLDRVGKSLDGMAAETQDLIRQLDDLQAPRSTSLNNPNRFEQIADPWLSPSSGSVRGNSSSSFDPHPKPSNVPDGWMQLPDGSIVASPSRMLPGITQKYTPPSNVPVNVTNPVHYVNKIHAKSGFGGGDVKTIARGNANLDIDVAEIQNGLAVRLKNGDVLTSSGRIYGTHPNGSNGIFPRSGSPDTVDLTKGEFDLFRKMIKAGGLKGKALQFYETRMNLGVSTGLDSQTPQKLTDLYNSRE